jgi:hypothetical protein
MPPPPKVFQPPKIAAVRSENNYIIRNGDALHPGSYIGMMDVGANLYPTILHYVTACLLTDLFKVGTENDQIDSTTAHQLVMAHPEGSNRDARNYVALETLPVLYRHNYDLSYDARMRRNATRALDKKFSHHYFQDLILMSGNAKLVYADVNNYILGIGPRKDGMNFVGEYLMYLRDQLRQSRKQIPQEITITDVESIVERDPFLKAWIVSRTNDMINAITFMGLYLCEKQQDCDNLSGKFVGQVLSYIYQPCSHLTALSRSVRTPVPTFYYDMVKGRMEYIEPEAIRVLWNYLATMIYFVLKYRSAQLPNIQNTIAVAQKITSSQKICEGPLEESFENCILLAIMRILIRVRSYNEKNKILSHINSEDIVLATRLILGLDIQEEDIPQIGGLGEMDDLSMRIASTLENYGIKEEDFRLGLNIMMPMIKGSIKFITDYPLEYNVKRNRVNFFSAKTN